MNLSKQYPLLFTAGVLTLLLLVSCTKKPVLERDPYNIIILHQEENHDSSISDKLVLTEKNVHDVIHYVKINYPEHKFDKLGYEIDNSSIKYFVNDFNENGPHLCNIYISGIPGYSGYSSVVSWLNGYLDIDEPRLFSFHFYFDEEYSDLSGISFSDFFATTKDSDCLYLFRQKYRDTDNYYWKVTWPLNGQGEDKMSNEEKTEILVSFLERLFATKVFLNLDLDWFGNAYTGIHPNEKIHDKLRVLLPKLYSVLDF